MLGYRDYRFECEGCGEDWSKGDCTSCMLSGEEELRRSGFCDIVSLQKELVELRKRLHIVETKLQIDC